MKTLAFSLAALLFPLVLWAEPQFNELQTYYKIKGYSSQDLRMALNKLGPVNDKNVHYDAYTQWYVNWKYTYHYDNYFEYPCYVTQVKVFANIWSIMPEWEDENSGDPSTQVKWDAYLLNLGTHEKGHADNGKKVAQEIEAALGKLGKQSNCSTLQKLIDRTALDIVKQHMDWDINYDLETQHGKTQGATFH